MAEYYLQKKTSYFLMRTKPKHRKALEKFLCHGGRRPMKEKWNEFKREIK